MLCYFNCTFWTSLSLSITFTSCRRRELASSAAQGAQDYAASALAPLEIAPGSPALSVQFYLALALILVALLKSPQS